MRQLTSQALWNVERRRAIPAAFLNDVAAHLRRILYASRDADRKALPRAGQAD